MYQNKSDLFYLTDNSYAEKIKLKSKFINAIREFLLERNYFETITPILQPFQILSFKVSSFLIGLKRKI